MKRGYEFPWGAHWRDGQVHFRLWAPAQTQVYVALEDNDALPMLALADGWHELITAAAQPGSRYCYVLQDGRRVADPAARFQPEDVHGRSEVIDPYTYCWRDTPWRGRPWHTSIIYELHVGTFTAEGTWHAARQRLPYLRSLGITAVELMPVADFPGQRNWGYDGVLLFAPDSQYGRPEEFKQFVEAAHHLDLMVFLDVVYNHFGPEGNYLASYAPQFFNPQQHTPWGAAINFDAEHNRWVRDFYFHNALYWLLEFNLDGLRFDAVHAINDRSEQHVMRELAMHVRNALPDRHVHLMLENDRNQASLLQPGVGADAQWNDDLHHGLHALATGENNRYYADYQGIDTLARALAEGFAFQGELMPARGVQRGECCTHLPPSAFIAFVQNHDQIGNRALGERIATLTPQRKLRAISAICLLSPQIPLLFMGEEWNSRQPFLLFCDFQGALGEGIRRGRRKEFSLQLDEWLPDPLASNTFRASRLAWHELDELHSQKSLAWYRQLLQLRQEHVVPLLPQMHGAGSYRLLDARAFSVQWPAGEHCLELLANFSEAPLNHAAARNGWFWSEGGELGAQTPPWSVHFFVRPKISR